MGATVGFSGRVSVGGRRGSLRAEGQRAGRASGAAAPAAHKLGGLRDALVRVRLQSPSRRSTIGISFPRDCAMC